MAVKSCKCVLVSLFALGFCLQLLALAEPCQKGQHWVRAHYRKGYIRADGVNVSATSVVAHCQDNPPSNQNWQVKLATGLPHAWQQGGERTVEWTLEQKERVLDALSPLPQVLLNTAIEGIYRLKTSKIDVDNPAAGFNGQIAIYDPAFSTRQNLSRVMAHEIAHEMYRQFSFADRTEYLNVTGLSA